MGRRRRTAARPTLDGPAASPGRLVVHADFPSALLGNRRTLTVYLPPGYDGQTTQRYPVVYMHDGQNLFDTARAAFGVAWQADATAERLINAGRIPPLLIVGIDNTPQRVDEYAYDRDRSERAGGRGALYARFVLDEVKPFIDATYRTLPDRRQTAVVGSSLGGLVSLAMAREHHEQFALCGAVSPSLWWAGGRILDEYELDGGWMRRMRFWLDMGTREESRRGHVPSAIRRARRLVASLDGARLVPGRDYYYWEVAGGEHNEAAWAARFDKVLLYFFGQ
jgi:predicted alpha/beta superfamily hydrolase